MTPQQLKWIEALESGKFEQGQGALCKDNKYCCLGIACDLFYKELGIGKSAADNSTTFGGHSGMMPRILVKHLGLHSDTGEHKHGGTHKSLVNLNDSGKSFKEIAEALRTGDYFVDTATT